MRADRDGEARQQFRIRFAASASELESAFTLCFRHLRTMATAAAASSLKVPQHIWPTAERAANALQGLLPAKLPDALNTSKKNLYQTLSSLPPEAVKGTVVHQTRWARKGIEGSYWKITRVQTKNMGNNGKAWGLLYWRGGYFLPLTCRGCADSRAVQTWG
jgi:hypothetical protein